MTNGKKPIKRVKQKKKTNLRALRAPQIDTSEHERTLIGLTDPFSEFASQARYPDQGAGRTLTFQQRMSQPLLANSGGYIAIAVNLKPNFFYISQTGVTGATVSWPAAYSPLGDVSTNLLNTYGKSYRPISAGIRITNLLSATNSSGSIVIAKSGPPQITTPFTTTFSPNNFSSWDMHPFSHGGQWHTTSRPRHLGAYAFGERSAYATDTAFDDTWETMYVYCSGLPASTNAAIAEIWINYEYTTVEDAPIAQLSQPQPILDVGMQTAINAVQSSHPASHKGTTDQVRGFIKREAKKALVKHVIPFVAKRAALALA